MVLRTVTWCLAGSIEWCAVMVWQLTVFLKWSVLECTPSTLGRFTFKMVLMLSKSRWQTHRMKVVAINLCRLKDRQEFHITLMMRRTQHGEYQTARERWQWVPTTGTFLIFLKTLMAWNSCWKLLGRPLKALWMISSSSWSKSCASDSFQSRCLPSMTSWSD